MTRVAVWAFGGTEKRGVVPLEGGQSLHKIKRAPAVTGALLFCSQTARITGPLLNDVSGGDAGVAGAGGER
jgi:hypothetical protein